MNDDQLQREIEEALAVEPSPQFTARVRQQLMQETTQRAMWLQWKVLATGLAAAAVLAAIVFYETPQAITSHPSHVTEVVLKRAPQEIPVVETRSTNVVQPKIRIRKVSKEP
jgi:hypothetical protein